LDAAVQQLVDKLKATEAELNQIKPLYEQNIKIVNEVWAALGDADFDNEDIVNKVQRRVGGLKWCSEYIEECRASLLEIEGCPKVFRSLQETIKGLKDVLSRKGK
jgi:hypothetical protein